MHAGLTRDTSIYIPIFYNILYNYLIKEYPQSRGKEARDSVTICIFTGV